MSNGKSFSYIITFVFFCLITAGFTYFIVYPKLVNAEIATVRDWIGLFAAEDPNSLPQRNNKSNTVNGNTWAYTSTCTQSPGPVPQLSRTRTSPDPSPCTFNISPTPGPGDYEYRMYANDYNNTSDPADNSGLIARSTPTRVGATAAGLSCPVQNLYPRAEGLISAPEISTNFGNATGQCVISSQAAFAPYKIPTYASLKSIYYTQSKLTKNTSLPSPLTFSADGIYNITSGLTIDSSPSGNGTEVIFVDGNLNINQNIIYHTNDGGGGLVFVVSGNVNIDPIVTQIDAVIISSGRIYTAGANCTTNGVTESTPGTPISALTINGTLVSLESGLIRFCRNLASNDQPAEIINQQAKYLVLLRTVYADTLQKWSEIQ